MGITSSRRIYILIFYFVFICFLFFLPGEAFPTTGSWFGAEYFDKVVHFGIFSILTFLVCWTLNASFGWTLLVIFAGAVVYGITVEVIQDQLITNRAFSMGDWAADIIGSIAGTSVWKWRFIKK